MDLDSKIKKCITDLDSGEKVSRWFVLRNYNNLIDFINANKKYEHTKTELSLLYDMAKESL